MYGVSTPRRDIYSEMDRLAMETPPGADGLIFIPYLSGTRTQPHLKASFTGLARRHGYAHLTRAILEAVVFELYHLYEKLAPRPHDDTPLIAAGGGFSSRFYDAYFEVSPAQPGIEDRMALYQLYYLLVHLNIFGPSYLAAVSETANSVFGGY